MEKMRRSKFHLLLLYTGANAFPRAPLCRGRCSGHMCDTPRDPLLALATTFSRDYVTRSLSPRGRRCLQAGLGANKTCCEIEVNDLLLLPNERQVTVERLPGLITLIASQPRLTRMWLNRGENSILHKSHGLPLDYKCGTILEFFSSHFKLPVHLSTREAINFLHDLH